MRWRNLALGVVAVVILMQFFQPEKNTGQRQGPQSLEAVMPVPGPVKQVLEKACYNCHSNHTDYPWYTHVQPLGWWLAHHVEEGKAELNFSEFGQLSARRQLSKMKSVAGSVEEGSMPLPSYLWTHPEARLTDAEKQLIMEWARMSADSLSR